MNNLLSELWVLLYRGMKYKGHSKLYMQLLSLSLIINTRQQHPSYYDFLNTCNHGSTIVFQVINNPHKIRVKGTLILAIIFP